MQEIYVFNSKKYFLKRPETFHNWPITGHIL